MPMPLPDPPPLLPLPPFLPNALIRPDCFDAVPVPDVLEPLWYLLFLETPDPAEPLLLRPLLLLLPHFLEKDPLPALLHDPLDTVEPSCDFLFREKVRLWPLEALD